jgi:hypothetical protein
MPVRRPKDVYAGLIFICIGATAILLSQQYEIGTARRMGPGYLPTAVGIVLMAFGAWLLLTAWRSAQPDPVESHALAPLGLIVGAVVSFALLIDTAGFVVAMAALVFVSCFYRAITNPLEVMLTYVTITAFSVAVFAYGLDVQLPLFWWH